MYISSFLLFCSSLAILYIGIKNCNKAVKKSITTSLNHYNNIIKVQQYRGVDQVDHDDQDNINFLQHAMLQQELNDELLDKI